MRQEPLLQLNPRPSRFQSHLRASSRAARCGAADRQRLRLCGLPFQELLELRASSGCTAARPSPGPAPVPRPAGPMPVRPGAPAPPPGGVARPPMRPAAPGGPGAPGAPNRPASPGPGARNCRSFRRSCGSASPRCTHFPVDARPCVTRARVPGACPCRPGGPPAPRQSAASARPASHAPR